ncbi:MAG TPA: MbcA/ParS/Xre antitoxin family protein [Trichormus sp.]|jgi:hypothetical protein
MTRTIEPTKTKSTVGLKAFFSIAEKWQLTNQEQLTLLGLTSESTFYKWKNNPESAKLDRDTFERISYVLGIFKDLQTLLSDTTAADKWIKTPNHAPLFGGRTALDVLCNGRVADLYLVRQYLAAQKGV